MKGSFYGDVCDLTTDEDEKGMLGGIINGFGAVSRTGYGDGGYSVYVARKDGKAVAARVVFIGDDEEDESGDEEE